MFFGSTLLLCLISFLGFSRVLPGFAGFPLGFYYLLTSFTTYSFFLSFLLVYWVLLCSLGVQLSITGLHRI